ncbi:M14 metallopeptidase family protein [Zobellia sp. 1_MG-2023]|uniref:M14 family metallopeptidase n=1 Tax=Zobellia sp. 1_MG-2023 TaxID=3062626 RepID=UPI0026E47B66|nr:M14 metallopeptidase family protein [Zobellia sp. 1_MG-2023]MDO6820375.1 M14 family metallopeptidase [Zobellia sp. 1_MG-2023]
MSILKDEYSSVKEKSVSGRYVINEQILEFLEKNKENLLVKTIGESVQKRKIKSLQLGNGSVKIFMWSQMHGNESTTTKAVLDFVNFLNAKSVLAQEILEKCTLLIIPMLNPDGAAVYTRVNANEIDLNRDAQDRTQPESVILRNIFDEFKPDYCFNLHDQRTIFNVGETSKPATVSFLAPAHDPERSISKTRGISMQLIVAMNTVLQKMIPNQVGRYDDGFNANCVGDSFQMLNVPTILFESGHFPKDYEREQTRAYIFQAITTAVTAIAQDTINEYEQDDYFKIPENGKLYFDVLIENAKELDSELENGDGIGVLYKEVLRGNTIEFEPRIEKKGNLDAFFGHETYNCLDKADLDELRQQSFYQLIKD